MTVALSELLAEATPQELGRLRHLLSVVGWDEWGRPKQQEPQGDWQVWLTLAGRGYGKTETICRAGHRRIQAGRSRRIALVAPTAADARDVVVEGETGLLATAPPGFRPVYEPSKRRVTWPNGAVGTLFSAEEPDRLRGPQHDLALCDEIAAWDEDEETWDMLMLGLRLGDDPRCIAASTPKPRRLIRDLVRGVDSRSGRTLHVHVTRGSTYENIENLAPTYRETVLARYEGTRLGRQELEGEILEDVEGALWLQATIDGLRGDPPTREVRYPGSPRDASGLSDEYDMPQVVVGVDPAASSSEDSDETGIVVAGRGSDGLLYVLADQSVRATPDGWGRRVIDACEDHGADEIVAEANNGGEMVSHVLRTVAQSLGMTPPIIRLVHASRGKRLRAEPIAAIYEQRRARHCGTFAQLEQQMTEWVPDSPQSPDRLDALVWAATRLMIESRPRLRYRGAA